MTINTEQQAQTLPFPAFDAIEDHLDEHDKKLDQLQYDLNQANGKLDLILERITGLSDLPEE